MENKIKWWLAEYRYLWLTSTTGNLSNTVKEAKSINELLIFKLA